MQDLPALRKNCNSKLQVKLETVTATLSEEYELIFELVTTGTLTADAKKRVFADSCGCF